MEPKSDECVRCYRVLEPETSWTRMCPECQAPLRAWFKAHGRSFDDFWRAELEDWARKLAEFELKTRS